jgi:hypothetical protein
MSDVVIPLLRFTEMNFTSKIVVLGFIYSTAVF